MNTSDSASLPYVEPGILTILILTSFLLFLNAVNHVLDKLIFCGLVGQVLLGIAWGTPGARFLDAETERVIVNLGYLGLILLVYEGGLSTSFRSLKANIHLSIAVALTGISLPIALSFILLKLTDATALQAFAAGAALCSTSLGTTFAVLRTSGLVQTRMGVVLSTAAMLDDVVGLVMVQVISNLGTATSQSFSPITVVRPIFVSLAFALLTPGCAYLIAKPGTEWLNGWRERQRDGTLTRLLRSQYCAVTVHTGFLIAMVVGSSYAGTSNLFAAYLTGAAISWWDTELTHPSLPASPPGMNNINTHTPTESISTSRQAGKGTAGTDIFDVYYGQALTRILKPFFFIEASIGFSIPITDLFDGSVVWRGIVYTILMFAGKLACGLWLLRLPDNFSKFRRWLIWPARIFQGKENTTITANSESRSSRQSHVQSADGVELTSSITSKERVDKQAGNAPRRSNESRKMRNKASSSSSKPNQISHPARISVRKPTSTYPSMILGSAMTARGEIGFLISSLAQSKNIFRSSQSLPGSGSEGNSRIFLVVTWAIMLCTILGPILVGILVKRVKRSRGESSGKDVLGDWGVE